jgi:hypothetical protein
VNTFTDSDKDAIVYALRWWATDFADLLRRERRLGLCPHCVECVMTICDRISDLGIHHGQLPIKGDERGIVASVCEGFAKFAQIAGAPDSLDYEHRCLYLNRALTAADVAARISGATA